VAVYTSVISILFSQKHRVTWYSRINSVFLKEQTYNKPVAEGRKCVVSTLGENRSLPS